MNYDGLEASYWTRQSTRLADARMKINTRVATPDEDLVIGSGRRLTVAVMFRRGRESNT
jgi:hypothetical protein